MLALARIEARNIPWSTPSISLEEKEAVLSVLDSGWLTQGSVTQEFEKELCSYTGTKNAIVVNNGTSALICALLAHDIGLGDEVISPTFTFISTVNAIIATGAKPVLVDCDKSTMNTTQELVEKMISKNTKAVIMVDVAGMPCDIDSFQDLANEYGLILIEDAAEGLGAEYRRRKIGSFDHTCVFSFHMAKQLSTIEGGCITTKDESLAKKCQMIRNYGMGAEHECEIFGLNFKITDIQSAIGLVQIQKLEKKLCYRDKIARIYKKNLRDLVEFQNVPEYVTRHPWMIFQILTNNKKERDSLRNELCKNGVDARICWLPVHLQSYHKEIFKKNQYRNAEDIASKSLTLPIGNALSVDDVDYVISVARKQLKSFRK